MSTNSDQELEQSVVVEPQAATVSRWRAVRRLWRAEIIYVLVLAAFGVLAAFAYFNAYFGWDLRVSSTFNWTTFSPPGLFHLLWFTSVFGNSWIPYGLTAVTIIAFLLLGLRSEAVALLLSTAGSGLINSMMKMLIARPRPSAEVGIQVYRDTVSQSFPSGHVTFYVCYFGFLFFVAYALLPMGSLARRLALTLTALPVALVGLSRIYLGAHWPSDTLGAYLWSGIWLAFSLEMYRRWKERATFHKSGLGEKQ